MIAELVAFNKAVKEALYIYKLVIVFGLQDTTKLLRINTNFANAIKLLQKPGFSSNKMVRWIKNQYFFIHDELQKKSIKFNHVKGINNVADGFTKPLDGDAFQRYMTSLNLDRAG
ncbi:Ty1/Copia family ribonuclease HI [Aspergillus stella-maris]|uniref:Ty1/Copia family ribonuclease HI n=1 Tax=Aspergillus stella-maris TaxID=1810926 RepID=UPI003CCDA5E5